jgi:hypothetical protein
VIRYKPVAKLSGKSGAKKGGGVSNNSDSNNNIRKPAAGPAPENNNNNLDTLEGIAVIEYRINNDQHDNTRDFDKKIKELEQLDKNIFQIEIIQNRIDYNRKTGVPISASDIYIEINIRIYFVNLSKAKENKNLEKKLNDLIEILKFFKKQETSKKFDTKVNLYEPNFEFGPTEHNQFLKNLANKIK